MARQLQERGETVAQVVLIDPRLRPERTLSFYSRRLRSALRRGELRRLVAGRLGRAVGGRRDGAGLSVDDAGIDVRIAALRDAYVLRPLDVAAALLTSEDYDDLGVPPSVWGNALTGLRSYRFAGAHEHLFLPPAVDHLASALRVALEEAGA